MVRRGCGGAVDEESGGGALRSAALAEDGPGSCAGAHRAQAGGQQADPRHASPTKPFSWQRPARWVPRPPPFQARHLIKLAVSAFRQCLDRELSVQNSTLAATAALGSKTHFCRSPHAERAAGRPSSVVGARCCRVGVNAPTQCMSTIWCLHLRTSRDSGMAERDAMMERVQGHQHALQPHHVRGPGPCCGARLRCVSHQQAPVAVALVSFQPPLPCTSGSSQQQY